MPLNLKSLFTRVSQKDDTLAADTVRANNTNTMACSQVVMPCLSFNHGSGQGDGPSKFLAHYVNSLPTCPRGVVVIEAHVEADPVEMVGDAELVKLVASLLQQQGIDSCVHRNQSHVMGHGAYDAKRALQGLNLPFVTVSLRADQTAAEHLSMGAALAPLRHQGVMLLGSGLPSFHNFHFMFSKDESFRSHVIEEAVKFDTWLLDTMSCELEERWSRLSLWQNAPGASSCHPPGEVEHFLPTLVIVGAAQDSQCSSVGEASHKEILPKLSSQVPLHHFDFRL